MFEEGVLGARWSYGGSEACQLTAEVYLYHPDIVATTVRTACTEYSLANFEMSMSYSSRQSCKLIDYINLLLLRYFKTITLFPHRNFFEETVLDARCSYGSSGVCLDVD